MRLPSHHCEFTTRDLLRRSLAPLLGVTFLAALLHAGSRLNALPRPVPADLDRTLLSAKVDLAAQSSAASVVLIGDSSCMMNIDATDLARRLGQPVLNLGTLSHLDLTAHAELLHFALQQRASPPNDVVLLVHPMSLRRGSSLPEPARFLRARLTRNSHASLASPRHRAENLLASVVVREQLLQSWIPTVLRGDFATEYGTTWEAQRRLLRQAGSLTDPTRFDAASQQGRYEFRLHPDLEPASRALRALVPQGTRLWVGLTPVPASLALPNHTNQVRELLRSWANWLEPVRVLSTLPSTLPESQFATATHLNPEGIATLTPLVAAELGRAIDPAPRTQVLR